MPKTENTADDAARPLPGSGSVPKRPRRAAARPRAVRAKAMRLPECGSDHDTRQDWIHDLLAGVDLADPGARLACLREVTVRRLLTLLTDAKLDTRLVVKLCDLMDITGSSATKALAEASADELGGFIGGLSEEDRAMFETLR